MRLRCQPQTEKSPERENGFDGKVNPYPALGRLIIVALVCAMTVSETSAQTVLSAVSRKTHGGAGDFDIDLPLGNTTGIECRSGGATNDYQLVVNFSGAVTLNGNPQAQVTFGLGTVGTAGVSNGGAVTVSGNSVTIPLTNVANAQRIAVTLFGINGGGNVVIPAAILIGDVNANGIVNASDVSQTKLQVGQPVAQGNFRTDVNASSFTNATDVAMVKSLAGSGLSPWLPDVRLTFQSAFSSTSFNNARCIATGPAGAEGEVLHVIFFEERDGNREIYYKRSTNGGTSWGPDVRLTNNVAVSHFPSIAVSDGIVHVVWEEYRDGNAEIYYKRSSDTGVTWGADTRLTNNSAKSLSPSLAVSGSLVHLTWFDQRDGNNEIYYKRSDDAGLSWGADTRLTNDPSASIYSAIAASKAIVHVVWEEHRHGNGEIYTKRSSDGGLTWGSDTRLTNNSANSFSPSIAVSGDDVNIAWFDQRDGNLEIYDKHSADGGLNWGADKRVTMDASVSNYPSVAVFGSDVHLVWFDERDGNTEIYYNHSTDNGATWATDIRLTNDAARSTDPCIALASSTIHVLWTDARDDVPPYDGNYEVYYKRAPPNLAVPNPTNGPRLQKVATSPTE
jgi:hypothetical protein